MIELTVEDIEALLDALGEPTDDDETRKHAREKLELALQAMRKTNTMA